MSIILFGCARKPEVVRRAPVSIVFFGDSVTYGYGVDTKSESFYARIHNIMKSGIYGDVITYNAGVSGDDTSEALNRMSTDVIAHDPDIVIIAFGLNDCLNKTITLDIFGANIHSMIAAVPAKTKIILATSNTFLDAGQSDIRYNNDSIEVFMKEIKKIAQEKELVLIDVHKAWKRQIQQDSRHMESMYVDPGHPSAKGHELIYNTYMNVLRRQLIK
ncbi:SGNH/GDSL hydrolase family protein [Candidatus Latescibacterota bacterium]